MVTSRQTLSNGLMGLGVASQLMPMFGGTLSPLFSSLANAVNPATGAAPRPQGGLLSRFVDPSTGIPKFEMLPSQTGPQFSFGGGGYPWKKYRKGGRGGGGGRQYTPYQRPEYTPTQYYEAPPWARGGLANW